jgi:zinc protease
MKTCSIRIVAAALCVAAVGSTAHAQKKVKDLTYPPLNQIAPPQPQKVTLDNGMTLYLLEDHTLPLVNIEAVLNCGSYLEPAAKVGLAEITGSVMRTGGTTHAKGDDIDAQLEAIGASVETGIGGTTGSASANALSEYTGTVISVLADVLRYPIFDQDKIDLAKTEQRAGISRRNDDPGEITFREFSKLIYGPESPYARHTEYATIESITRDDLVKFHRDYVQPQNIQLAAWGDFKTAEMVETLKKSFGDWPRGEQPAPAPPEVKYDFKPSLNYAEKTDVNQSNILIGHIGGKMGDPDYPATIVMNGILSGFGGRLFDEVRTKLGLAYSVSGAYTFGFDAPGLFYVTTSTKSASTVEAIDACKKQIQRMKTDPPTPEEMKRSKDGYLNAFVFNFDTQGEVLERLMTYDRKGFPADYLQQIKAGVEKVTPEDVVAVAKRKLNEGALQVLVVGNGPEFGRPLSELGEVNVIDITIPEPSAAAFAATPEESARGHELLLKSAEACGGVAAFKKAQAIEREAKVTLAMPQGSMELGLTTLTVFPSSSRQVIKTPMGEQILVFNGTDAWMEMMGKKQPLPGAEKADMMKEMERNLARLYQTADEPDYQVAWKGSETFDGKPVERLDFLSASGGQFTLYVDAKSFRPAGLHFTGNTAAGPGEITETFQELGPAGKLMLPTKVHRDEGAMTMDILYTGTNLSPKYNEVDFQKPEGL